MLLYSAAFGASTGDPLDRQLELGSALVGQGRYQEARLALEKARGQAEQLGPDDARLAIALNNLGAVALRLNDIAAADRYYRRSATIWKRRGDAVNALGPVSNLAAVYLARAQYTSADALLQHALELSEAKLGPDHAQTAVILAYLSDSAFGLRDLDTAAHWSERSLAIVRRIHPEPHPNVAVALDNLGTIYREQKRLEESSRLYTEAVAVLDASGQPEHPAWIRALNGYSAVYFDQGRYEEAEPLLQRSLALAEKTLGPNHPGVARILRDYAVLMRKTKRKGEARKLELQAAQIMDQAGRDNALGYTVDQRALTGFR
jgi:tetratricopeptide (TPR) repeat protein